MSGGSKKSVPEIPTEGTSLQNPITYYRSRTGVYPSNAEVWWAYRRPLELGSDGPPKSYLEVFDPSLRYQITTGNSQVARGHYILDGFFRDRSGASGVSGLAVESAGGHRPNSVAFYAGRVFYAGVNISGFNTHVYFSQIIERPEQVQECYQALDPTDETLRDLLPSDGGVIVIPEISEIYHLHVMGPYLFIFARNGVWQVSGSQGIGFRANDYSVVKLSGNPAISNMSFVSAEGAPMWWNRTGIYTITINEQGVASVQSLTEETIKEFYNDIPSNNKFYAKGAYDPLLQRVQWLYRSEETTETADNYKYDEILNFDTRTGAFYPHSLAQSPRIDVKGIFDVEGFSIVQTLELVTADGETVTADDENVTILLQTREPIQSKFKYIVNIKAESELPEPPDPVE